MGILIVKFVCLVLAITYGYSNTVKSIRGDGVSNAQMFLMGISIAGFIFFQWVI